MNVCQQACRRKALTPLKKNRADPKSVSLLLVKYSLENSVDNKTTLTDSFQKRIIHIFNWNIINNYFSPLSNSPPFDDSIKFTNRNRKFYKSHRHMIQLFFSERTNIKLWDIILTFQTRSSLLQFSSVSRGGVRLSPFGMSTTDLPMVPAPDRRWSVWSSRLNDNWQGKPAPLPLCPPKNQHDMIRARTRAPLVGSWAMTRQQI